MASFGVTDGEWQSSAHRRPQSWPVSVRPRWGLSTEAMDSSANCLCKVRMRSSNVACDGGGYHLPCATQWPGRRTVEIDSLAAMGPRLGEGTVLDFEQRTVGYCANRIARLLDFESRRHQVRE